MLKEERHQKILDEVSLRNRILLIDMVEQLDVSIDTIRRDVKELDKKSVDQESSRWSNIIGFCFQQRLG